MHMMISGRLLTDFPQFPARTGSINCNAYLSCESALARSDYVVGEKDSNDETDALMTENTTGGE